MQKAGRNDPCPCGSGKKFKKCCELKIVRGRLSANRITSVNSSSPTLKASGLTSLFQNRLTAITPRKPPPAEEAPAPSQEAGLEEKPNLLITS